MQGKLSKTWLLRMIIMQSYNKADGSRIHIQNTLGDDMQVYCSSCTHMICIYNNKTNIKVLDATGYLINGDNRYRKKLNISTAYAHCTHWTYYIYTQTQRVWNSKPAIKLFKVVPHCLQHVINHLDISKEWVSVNQRTYLPSCWFLCIYDITST